MRNGSVHTQVSISEEEVVHQPSTAVYTPHVSTAPPTFLSMSEVIGASHDDPLLKEGYKTVTSNGNAGLVAASLANNRAVISHNKATLVDTRCSATKSGQRLSEPWSEMGLLNGDYVTSKGKMDMHAVSFQDQPTLRTETMLRADSDAQKLHSARILNNNAPVDFKTLLNDGESVIMQIKCKGLHGIPSNGGDVVGDCWLILTRMVVQEQESRRIYFYQSAHASRGYSVVETKKDDRCLCCVAQDSKARMVATRTETAFLDMLTVEDQLVHAHYEQMKRTQVEKISRTYGHYIRPACVRDGVANLPSCSLDLCQAAENDHCTLPLCCCLSCVVPWMCRPGYAMLTSSSEPPATLEEVVTHVSTLSTERAEESAPGSDVPITCNKMEVTNVQESDFYAISIQFAFPNRGKLREALAIVCPSEPVGKALKFVMLISQKPTLLDCPEGSENMFRVSFSCNVWSASSSC